MMPCNYSANLRLRTLAEWLFDDAAGLEVTDDQLDDILGPYLTPDAWKGPGGPLRAR
jgi:hypothetical protein